jgi:hypothetical protein
MVPMVWVQADDQEERESGSVILSLHGRWGICEKEGEMTDNEKILRQLLWLRHGCPMSSLYGDDGEMQCHTCGIDFKRDKPGKIDERFYEIGLSLMLNEKVE